jgi:hypothetical protein
MSFEGEQGTGLEPDQKIGWASCYAAIETTPEDSRFGILVINGRGKFVRLQKRETLLEYLSWLFIADDDELEFLKAPIVVNRNRLTGKEYLYIKGTELFTRGRIFDTGDKIYVVVFVGKNVADLTSQDAETFFNSFRRQNQRRNLQARNRVHIKHR